MTADVTSILAGSVSAALTLLCVYLVYKLITVYEEGNHLRDLLDDGIKRESLLTADRDGLSVQLDVAKTMNKTLLDRVAVTESQRNNAQREVAEKVAEEIRHAPTSSAALDVLNRILSAQLPAASDPAPTSDGVPPPDPVHAAEPAAGVQGGGDS